MKPVLNPQPSCTVLQLAEEVSSPLRLVLCWECKVNNPGRGTNSLSHFAILPE
jgi:hypothetical protein